MGNLTHFEEALFLFSHLSIFPNTGLESTLEPKTVKQKAEEELVSTFFPLPFSHYTPQKILPTFPRVSPLGPTQVALAVENTPELEKKKTFLGKQFVSPYTPQFPVFFLFSVFSSSLPPAAEFLGSRKLCRSISASPPKRANSDISNFAPHLVSALNTDISQIPDLSLGNISGLSIKLSGNPGDLCKHENGIKKSCEWEEGIRRGRFSPTLKQKGRKRGFNSYHFPAFLGERN